MSAHKALHGCDTGDEFSCWKERKRTSTLPVGYNDLGYSGRAVYSDLNPHDGGQSRYIQWALYIISSLMRGSLTGESMNFFKKQPE